MGAIIHAERREGNDMAVSPDYRDYVLELLAPMGGLRHTAMFGGVGIYSHDVFFALIAEDAVYLKVDAVSQPDFEAAGCEPFRPFGGDKPMSYWSVPLEALEDPDLLVEWAGKGIEAAMRAKTGKKKR